MRHRRTLALACGASLATLVFAVPALHAQGTARSLDFETSVRSAGMGGASNAVFWGGDGSAWANPALLGYHRGLVHQWNRTQLVPGLAADVYLVTERQSLGVYGVGLMQGDLHLDYGNSEGTDPEGNPTGAFNSFERSTYQGVGVSVSSLVRALAGLGDDAAGPLARVTDRADLAFGYTHKRVYVDLGPGPSDIPARDGTDASDWGLLARVSPLRGYDLGGVPVGLDLAYGHSVINASDSELRFFLDSSPLSRIERDGYAARVGAGLPAGWRARMQSGWRRWLAASLEPLVEASYAHDSEHVSAGGGPNEYDVTRWGGELALANLVWVRTGHVTDREGDIDGGTTGWGLGLSIGGVVGYRYDFATVPQAQDSGLEDVQRRGWTAYFDPLALVRMMRP